LAIIISQEVTRVITSSSFQHVLKMSSCSTSASDRHWHHLPTARSVTARLKWPTQLLMYYFSLSTYNFKMKTK